MNIDWLLADVEQVAAPPTNPIYSDLENANSRSGNEQFQSGIDQTKQDDADNIAEQALAGLEDSGLQASTYEEASTTETQKNSVVPRALNIKKRRRLLSKETFAIAALAMIAVGVWAFPVVSKIWLKRELIAGLDDGESSESRLQSLAGLRSFLPESLPYFVDQFEQSDTETSAFAYQSLDSYLDVALPADDAENDGAINALISLLDSRSNNLHPESRRYAVALASRVLGVAIDRTDSRSQQITAAARRVMSILETPSPQTLVAQALPQISADRAATLPQIIDETSFQSASNSNERTSSQGDSTVVTLSDNDAELTSTKTLAQFADAPGNADVISNSASREPQRISAQLSSSTDLVVADLSDVPSLPDPPVHQELPEPINLSPAAANENSLSEDSPSTNSLVTNNQVSKPNDAQPVVAAPSVGSGSREKTAEISGLDRLADGEIVRLLTSVQPRYVRAAYAELERRGYSEQQLSLAIDLAQSDAQQRIQLMQQLATSPDFNPIPWLVWMAEIGDQSVKMNAVSLLGSFQNDVAKRQLRELSRRETDAQVIERINTALLYEPSQPRVANASYRNAQRQNRYR